MDQAAAICKALSSDIMTTAVLVNESYGAIMEKVKAFIAAIKQKDSGQ